MEDGHKVIYEQRYETYRHLDNLRWFIFQIAISVVAGILALQGQDQMPSILPIGLLLFSSGLLIAKINNGIDENNIVLRDAGIKIGDTSIPDPSGRNKCQSVSWLTAYGIIFIGLVMLLSELSRFFC